MNSLRSFVLGFDFAQNDTLGGRKNKCKCVAELHLLALKNCIGIYLKTNQQHPRTFSTFILKSDNLFYLFWNRHRFLEIYFHDVKYDIRTTFFAFSVKKAQTLLSLLTLFSLLYLFRRIFHPKIVQNELFTKLPFGCIIQKLLAAPTPQPRTTVFIALRNINLMISNALGIDSRLCFFFSWGELEIILLFLFFSWKKLEIILLFLFFSWKKRTKRTSCEGISFGKIKVCLLRLNFKQSNFS